MIVIMILIVTVVFDWIISFPLPYVKLYIAIASV
jgi:hypothetical protein